MTNRPPPGVWQSMEDCPADEPVLLYLPVPNLGKNIVAGMKMTISNGFMWVIDGYNIWDLESEPVRWCYPPEPPEDI